MGASVSMVECNIPARALIDVENGQSVISACTRVRIAKMWGFVVVISLGLLAAHWLTRNNVAGTKLVVPLWLVSLPVLVGVLLMLQAKSNALIEFKTAQLEQQLFGMTKKEYIQHKAGDDRAALAFTGQGFSAGVLTSGNILGPFLRGNR